jgi:chromosome segregation ATPase
MAVSRETIWAIADAMDADGMRPTLNAIRKKLGAGSFSTIAKAMSEWKERQRTKAQANAEPLPEELVAASNTLAEEVWIAARAAADRALTGERERMEAEHVELREQASEAAELADSLTEEVERLREQVTAAQAAVVQRGELLRELAALKAENQRAAGLLERRESEALRASQGERAALDRAAHAEGQVEALRDQLAKLTDTLRELRPGKSR